MTIVKKMLEKLAFSSPMMKNEIHKDDEIKFKDLYQSIDVRALDRNYKFPLTQKFTIEYASFRETVLDNLSKKKINISFIDQNGNDIGLVFHYSDLDDGKLNEATDSLYRINGMHLDRVPNTSDYTTLRENFKKNLGKHIAQQTKAELTEVVSFKMTDVINYLLINVYKLPRVSQFEDLKIDFEILQYTDENVTVPYQNYKDDKNRLSVGARLSYSYLDNGTLVTGKLPLYDIGTLHP